MEPGPSTTRPHADPGKPAAHLRHASASIAILTTPEGELLGIVHAGDLPDESQTTPRAAARSSARNTLSRDDR